MEKNKKKSKFLLNKSLSVCEQLTTFKVINEEEENEMDDGQKKEVKRQIGIFQEFKIKYDQLRKENHQKRNQIDDLNRLNKRQEIQLLNINTDFYDRQIKRLREQVQKLQEISQDFKFKYFDNENNRKELESSLNLKEKQVTTTLKQIEVEKVQNAQLKLQIKQNQRQFLKIIATVQESSNNSVLRFTESQNKLSVAQGQLRKIKKQLQSEKKKSEKLQKCNRELQEEYSKANQKHNIQITNLSKELGQAKNRGVQYRKQTFDLKEQILNLNLEQTKRNSLLDFQAKKTFEKITQFRFSQIVEFENKRLKQENEDLKKQLSSKNILFHTLENRFTEGKAQLQLQRKQYEQKLQDLKNKKIAIQKHYEGKNISLNKQIETLKVKCIKWESIQMSPEIQSKIVTSYHSQGKSSFGSSQETNPLVAFQNQFQLILRSRDEEIKSLRSKLNLKIEETFKLKQQLEDLRISTESMKGEIEILEKKWSVQGRNITSRNQIQVIEMKNQIQILKRKLSQAQAKIGFKTKQIKEKDSFITNSIINRVLQQQDVTLILAEMQRVLESDCIQKLATAEAKIKVLEVKLTAH